ncbi:MAG: hypothetical protein AAGI01_06280 [Myxococcota bacterium]
MPKTTHHARLTALFDEVLPIHAPRAELTWAGRGDDAIEVRGEDVLVTMRLVFRELDEDSGMLSIRDIVEQPVCFARTEHLEDFERFSAFVRGWADVVRRALEHPEVDTWMPTDFVYLDALELKRPKDAEDYRRALSVASRLGKVLDDVG